MLLRKKESERKIQIVGRVKYCPVVSVETESIIIYKSDGDEEKRDTVSLNVMARVQKYFESVGMSWTVNESNVIDFCHFFLNLQHL